MPKNLNKSDLDFQPAMQRCIDASEDALRVMLESELAIELNAADGDSVIAHNRNESHSVNLSVESLAIPVAGLSKVSLYVECVVPVESDVSVALQVSPLDEGDLWVTLEMLNITPASGVLMLKPVAFLARRLRVIPSRGPTGSEQLRAHIVLSS